jgi:hypothetical protein
MMHLQVQGDVEQGQSLMKYATNHPKNFKKPVVAFMIGLMQFIGGIACEIACLIYLSNIESPMETIIRFIAMAKIADIDNLYAAAKP